MIAMKYNLIINISTLDPKICDWVVGQRALSLVFANPKLAPMKISNLGEVSSRNGVKVSTLEECEAFWATKTLNRFGDTSWDDITDFFWNRTKTTKSAGMITFPKTGLRGQRISGGFF